MMHLFLILALSVSLWPVLGLGQSHVDDPIIIVQDTSSQNELLPITSENEEIIVEVDQTTTEKALDPGNDSAYVKRVKKLSDVIPKKLQSLFNSLRVPSKISQFVVSDIQAKLEKAPHIIRGANAQGGTFRLFAMTGLGISELMVNSLKTKKFGKFIPLNGRFGIVFGGGITILKFKQGGRNKILIRFFADVEKVDRMISWMVEAFAGGSLSKVSAQVEEQVKFFEKVVLPRSNLGFAGQLTLGDKHFEHAISLGTPFTSIPASTYFYETQVSQYRINFLFGPGWIKRATNQLIRSCRAFFIGS